MTKITLIASLITFISIFSTGQATRCWECNSNINPLCYYFDPSRFAPINCAIPPYQHHKALLEAGIQINRSTGQLVNPRQSFCRKIEQKGNHGWSVIRGCGYFSENELRNIEIMGTPSKRCIEKESNGQIYMRYCNCYEDECNSSISLKVNYLFILLISLLAYFKMQII